MKASPLKVGVDVPWVTSWSGEAVLGVRPCGTAEGRLAVWQADRPGVGRPHYARNHLQRQRRSVREMLCPMCGAATGGADRWSLTGRVCSAGDLRALGLGRLLAPTLGDERLLLNAGAIAPLHRACAARALARCPHLRADGEQALRRFPAQWVVTPLFVEGRPAVPSLGAKPVAVVSFLQLYGLLEAASGRSDEDG